MSEPPRRRRRVRHGSEPTATPEIADDPETSPEPAEAEPSPAERGLRGLVGGGSSQVSPAAAMRARDAARPLDRDLDAAENDLVIVRRHWTPRP